MKDNLICKPLKKAMFFLVSVLSLLGTNAQEWKPVNTSEKYNYALGDNQYYATIWIDSVRYINNDSIYFFNKIIKKVKTGDESGNKDIRNYYLNNQSQFFLSQLHFNSKYEYVFKETENKKYFIKAHARLNESWLFDSINNITAQVSKIDEAQVFGYSDSIKIIALSSQDTILISKNSGILKFPLFDTLKESVQLTGIEGRDVGFIVPKYFDFFNFSSGDVFCYRASGSTRWMRPETLTKLTVLSKHFNNDTLKYYAHRQSRTISYDWNDIPEDTVYKSEYDTLIYFDTKQHFLNKYSNQTLNDPRTGYTFKPIIPGYDSVFNTTTKTYGDRPFCQSDTDTIIEYNNPYLCSYVLKNYEIYGKNRGLITSYYYEFDSPYGITSWKYLTGCIVNGKTYGTIFNDQVITGTRDYLNSDDTEIYPNPASKTITVSIGNNGTHKIKISDVNGKLLISKEIRGSTTQIDVSNLHKGLYFVTILSDKRNRVIKLIKE